MRLRSSPLLLTCILCSSVLVGCEAGDESVPPAPSVIFSTSDPEADGAPTLSWEPVFEAHTYDVYLRTVPTELGLIPPDQRVVTTRDPKFADVYSPFRLTDFNKCGTSYLFIVTAENQAGESDPGGVLGYGPPPAGCAPRSPGDASSTGSDMFGGMWEQFANATGSLGVETKTVGSAPGKRLENEDAIVGR